MTTDSAAAERAPSLDYPPPSVAWLATLLLTVAYTFSFIDRQIVNLLVEPIQRDLGLSDSSVSLLQGFAFVIPYILLSMPLGRWVDRSGRTRILTLGVIFWSVACIACGLSRNYGQLLLARMGVGAGEASLTPACWSLLADYFPEERRSFPVSCFLMGPYLGAGLSMILGAEVIRWAESVGPVSLPLIGALAPWQLTFIAVGAPGAIIALGIALLREPTRKDRASDSSDGGLSWRYIAQYLATHWRLYCGFLLGPAFMVMVLYALQAWVPTLLVRIHGLSLTEVGRSYGVIALVAGSSGVLSGPVIGRWLARSGYGDYALRVAIAASVLLLPATIAVAFAGSATLALACVALSSYLVTLPLALFASGLQSATPNEMRGFVAGLYVLTVNLIGMGLAPMAVAIVTDFVFADPLAVGKSLAVVAGVAVPAALIFFLLGMQEHRR